MASIPSLSGTLQTVLTATAESLARQTGVIRRQRKLSGAVLLQTLILGWLAHPAASLTQLTQMAARRGVVLSPQALDQRFTPALVECLSASWVPRWPRWSRWPSRSPSRCCSASPASGSWTVPPLACRSGGHRAGPAVADGRGKAWPPSSSTCASISGRGSLEGPDLSAGRTDDRRSALHVAALPTGSLRLSDLGYSQPGGLSHDRRAGELLAESAASQRGHPDGDRGAGDERRTLAAGARRWARPGRRPGPAAA